MKKTLIAMAILASAFSAGAQDVQTAAAEAAKAIAEAEAEKAEAPKPVYWTKTADFDLGFNQTGLTNWAAGGYNTVSMAAGIDGKANYAKDLMSWNNRLQMNYGFLWSADKSNLIQKSTDRLYLESTWAYRTGKDSKWNYSASFNFRSQFTKGYDKWVQDPETQKWSGTLKSGFISPAYTNIALGMEWKPTEWFNMNIAPLTGGFTICTIDELKKGYGMKLREEGLDAAIGANYRAALFQFGAQVKINAKAVINDVFTYDTQLVVFTDYLSNPFVDNRVNWDNKISWKATKLFKVALDTWLLYDPIVTINDVTSLTQFKEFFSINFTYTISGKKK